MTNCFYIYKVFHFFSEHLNTKEAFTFTTNKLFIYRTKIKWILFNINKQS